MDAELYKAEYQRKEAEKQAAMTPDERAEYLGRVWQVSKEFAARFLELEATVAKLKPKS